VELVLLDEAMIPPADPPLLARKGCAQRHFEPLPQLKALLLHFLRWGQPPGGEKENETFSNSGAILGDISNFKYLNSHDFFLVSIKSGTKRDGMMFSHDYA